MKNNIDRTLFWFKNGSEKLLDLDYRFFGLSTLLNRLLNENYTGKRIQFINIDFSSEATYNLFPNIPMNYIHYYGGGGGHLRFLVVDPLAQFH